MESRSNFDFKSNLDFPSLRSNFPNSNRNISPQEKRSHLQNGNWDSQDNSRSMGRGRGKKQNWKAIHVEFSNGQRYQQRGASRPRFGNNHAIPKPADEPYEFSYRGYRSGSRSRIRRARGGAAPHNFGRPQSVESTTPLLSNSPTSVLSPPIMAIPYTPNYTAYIQPYVTALESSAPVNIPEAIRHQIEYYFSEENLIKDNYMRLNMTSEGFLPIQLISNFNKIKQFNVDIETITRAIEVSDKLDVVDRKIIRPVIDPLRWPLNLLLPPPVSNKMKNFVQSASPVSPLQSNGTLLQEAVAEIDTSGLMYQPGGLELIGSSPINDMVFQNVEDSMDHLSTGIGSITFEEKAVFSYPQGFPTEMQDQQNSLDETLDQDAAYPIDSRDKIIQEKSQTVNCQKDSQQDVALKVLIANGYNSHPNDTNQDSFDTKTIIEKVTYNYNSLYPTDSKSASHCQQDASRFQHDSQDVGRYQHKFTHQIYVYI